MYLPRLFPILLATCASLLFPVQAAAFDLFGPKKEAPPLRTGYTCCNLHYEGDWISDANWGEMPFIAAGAPIKVTGYGRYRVHVEIDGKPMRLGLDYGRIQETLEQFAEKLVVLENPQDKIRKFPADVREAIRLGKVMPGMTKEQAIIAVGYPMTSETASLDAPVWNYWLSSFAQYQLVWGKDGRIKDVIADPITRAKAVYVRGE